MSDEESGERGWDRKVMGLRIMDWTAWPVGQEREIG